MATIGSLTHGPCEVVNRDESDVTLASEGGAQFSGESTRRCAANGSLGLLKSSD